MFISYCYFSAFFKITVFDSFWYFIRCINIAISISGSENFNFFSHIFSNKVPKWKNNYGFAKSQYLYGFYQNKEDIVRTKTVVLVEGQGDVWRLWEAGIRNAVGLFGTSLSAAQLFTLRTACIVNLVVILDNDPAGIIAREKINTTCSNIFNIINIETSSNDVGDMTIQEINEQIKPNLEGLI